MCEMQEILFVLHPTYIQTHFAFAHQIPFSSQVKPCTIWNSGAVSVQNQVLFLHLFVNLEQLRNKETKQYSNTSKKKLVSLVYHLIVLWTTKTTLN